MSYCINVNLRCIVLTQEDNGHTLLLEHAWIDVTDLLDDLPGTFTQRIIISHILDLPSFHETTDDILDCRKDIATTGSCFIYLAKVRGNVCHRAFY